MYYCYAEAEDEASTVAIVITGLGLPARVTPGDIYTIDAKGWQVIWTRVQQNMAAKNLPPPDHVKVAQALMDRGYQFEVGVVPGVGAGAGGERWYDKVAKVIGGTVREAEDLLKRLQAGEVEAQRVAKEYGLQLYRDPVTGEWKLATMAPPKEPSTAETIWESVKSSLPILLVGAGMVYLVVRPRRR